MRLIKSLAVSAIAVTLAGQAVAGGFAPVVDVPEPVVVVEPEAPRSTWGILLPLALLGGLVAVALANDDDDEDGDGGTPDDSDN